MKILLAGAGPMAIDYARVLGALGADWFAVGRGAASAERFAAEIGKAPMRGGLGAFLRDARGTIADAAIVALPIPELAGAAQALVGAGVKRLLVEKPAGLDFNEIRALTGFAEASGAEIYVAYNRRYMASTREAARMIADDGGVTSFQFEFTEVAERIVSSGKDPRVLAQWFLGNSSHVIDLAFHLAGAPAQLYAQASGRLNWHPAGAVFTGAGTTRDGVPFSYHADWSSAGRWGVDIRTARRRLILQPLEQLKMQMKGSFAIEDMTLDDELDRNFKPGLYRQSADFLAGTKGRLQTIAAHARTAEIMNAMRAGASRWEARLS